VGSYLESLYNEWFDTKIRDEMQRMRERDQDEMEILENTRLNLQDLKGELTERVESGLTSNYHDICT